VSEKIGYFGVAHLMEIAIVEADCPSIPAALPARRAPDAQDRAGAGHTRIVALVAMPSSTTIAVRRAPGQSRNRQQRRRAAAPRPPASCL